MTDKEKIELIIQEKQLNNTQFCNKVGIVPGTLSHIRSGRTEPSLNILRNISQAFPDINPAWLFYDQEPMYLDVLPPTSENEVADAGDSYIDNVPDGEVSSDGQMSLFAFPTSASSPVVPSSSSAPSASPVSSPSSAPSSTRPTSASPSSMRPAAISPSARPSSVASSSARPSSMPTASARPAAAVAAPKVNAPSSAVPASPVSVQEIVAETLKQQQKSLRKVVEVRIFFDDGTFETFSAT